MALRRYVRTCGVTNTTANDFALSYATYKLVWELDYPYNVHLDVRWVTSLAALANLLLLLDNFNVWKMRADGDPRGVGMGRTLSAAAFYENFDQKIRSGERGVYRSTLFVWRHFGTANQETPAPCINGYNQTAQRQSPALGISRHDWTRMIRNIYNEPLQGVSRDVRHGTYMQVVRAVAESDPDWPPAAIGQRLLCLGIIDGNGQRFLPVHTSTVEKIKKWASQPAATRDELLRMHIWEDLEVDCTWVD
ncbi:hypothetical protein Slin15195_G116290 [Septoria linicola]|uniref:Uncharacterized protein n=1 Tax=Septoria linicola TaxID=215465 RepID=A0A9Q9B083_9PEZI|nr:hypothetical protein Slin15195_G116290 [Septoria linicola]